MKDIQKMKDIQFYFYKGRKIFYIDVGDMSLKKAKKVIEDIAKNLLGD